MVADRTKEYQTPGTQRMLEHLGACHMFCCLSKCPWVLLANNAATPIDNWCIDQLSRSCGFGKTFRTESAHPSVGGVPMIVLMIGVGNSTTNYIVSGNKSPDPVFTCGHPLTEMGRV